MTAGRATVGTEIDFKVIHMTRISEELRPAICKTPDFHKMTQIYIEAHCSV